MAREALNYCRRDILSKALFVNQNTDDRKKTEDLHSLDGAKERLYLLKVDLLEGAFDTVDDGCVGVFHTALSAQFSATDPQAEIVEPAVKGTLNVLKSCAKFPSVKRVVLTSSIASVMGTGTPLASDVRWYPHSKTLAEEAA
ncbi:hypothetical protein ACFX13_040458 [Malus domestica]